MPTYQYVGPTPTVFTTIQKDGETWTAAPGDLIDLDIDPGHPWIQLVAQTKAAKTTDPTIAESPAAVDEPEENN